MASAFFAALRSASASAFATARRPVSILSAWHSEPDRRSPSPRKSRCERLSPRASAAASIRSATRIHASAIALDSSCLIVTPIVGPYGHFCGNHAATKAARHIPTAAHPRAWHHSGASARGAGTSTTTRRTLGRITRVLSRRFRRVVSVVVVIPALPLNSICPLHPRSCGCRWPRLSSNPCRHRLCRHTTHPRHGRPRLVRGRGELSKRSGAQIWRTHGQMLPAYRRQVKKNFAVDNQQQPSIMTA